MFSGIALLSLFLDSLAFSKQVMSHLKLYSGKEQRASQKYDLNTEVTDKRLLSSLGYELVCHTEIKWIKGRAKKTVLSCSAMYGPRCCVLYLAHKSQKSRKQVTFVVVQSLSCMGLFATL